ncbi:MAG TPA: alpha/beta hydrolase family protein [Myxococcota bacterium]|nr:alpha/beta hydrolase family protein [Myxococcota bacterium]
MLENALAIVAGLCWIAAGQGPWSFLVAAVPGSLLLAGGVSSLLLPGDPRTPQLTALGAFCAVVAALPLLFMIGFTAFGLLALAVAAFVACGWAAQRAEPPIERVPHPALDLELATKVAFDQLALASLIATRPRSMNPDVERAARELREAREHFEASGWLEKPASYHETPPALDEPVLRWGRAFNQSFERLSFASGYEPRVGDPGRDRWLSYGMNREAHAHVLRHGGAARPWLVCIHGYGMGAPATDLAAFQARRLHHELGLNLLLPVLPLHGARAPRLRSGDGFLSGDFLDTVHAEAQAMWDIRRLLSWVRAQGATQIGVYGLSLGGYTAALLACLDGGLDSVIAGIPAADFIRLVQRLAPHRLLREIDRLGFDWEILSDVLSVVSPLVLTPLVPRERLSIFGATADHLVPADQVRDLWRHWGEPRIAWYAGSHVSFPREPQVRFLIDDALRIGGLTPAAALSPSSP